MASISVHLQLLLLLLAGFQFAAVPAQLSSSFYLFSCPAALATIKLKVLAAVATDRRMAASLLRLHFHDCFVNGCDGSVLLDDTSSFTGEKTATPNQNSLRGFEVVDSIKSALEDLCPQTVSCADILAVAARDAVVAVGGPSWRVPLGRRDSTTASFSGANNELPPPIDNLNELISAFASKGLSTTDLVALSGAHTIGKARCITFRGRIYNDTNVDSAFALSKQGNCPSSGGDNNLAVLDTTENLFDNSYYKNLLNLKGLLHSDQELFNGASTDELVQTYSINKLKFFSDFASAMVKMGNIDPLTGSSGEVRKDCRVVN